MATGIKQAQADELKRLAQRLIMANYEEGMTEATADDDARIVAAQRKSASAKAKLHGYIDGLTERSEK